MKEKHYRSYFAFS